MPKTKLRNLLRQLQEELEDAKSVGPEAQDLMRDVMDDIQEVLERAEDDDSGDDTSMKGRLDNALVEFENDHPQVAFTIKRIMKGLSDIGI